MKSLVLVEYYIYTLAVLQECGSGYLITFMAPTVRRMLTQPQSIFVRAQQLSQTVWGQSRTLGVLESPGGM